MKAEELLQSPVRKSSRTPKKRQLSPSPQPLRSPRKERKTRKEEEIDNYVEQSAQYPVFESLPEDTDELEKEEDAKQDEEVKLLIFYNVRLSFKLETRIGRKQYWKTLNCM